MVLIRCVFLGLLLSLSLTVSAQKVRFTTIDVPPWASINAETGQAEGAFPDIVAEIERRLKQSMPIYLTPFGRVARELDSGEQDCTILITTEELTRVAHQGQVLFHHSMGVIARKGISLNSYSDLKPLTISVLRGLNTNSRFDDDTELNKEFDTSYTIGLRKLDRGRLDAIFGAIPTITHLAKQHGYYESLGDSLVLERAPLHLQCSKKTMTRDQMRILERAIDDMREEGVLDAIKAKYNF